MTVLDILTAISFYLIGGLIANVLGMYLQFYVSIHLKKLQMKELTKNAPEVEDTRVK